MLKITNIGHKLIPVDELLATIKRFPLSILCAVILFILGILLIHGVIDGDDDLIGKVFAVIGSSYFWFGAAVLIGESYRWSYVKQIIISIIGAGVILAIAISSNLWWLNLSFVLPSLLLLIMFAPYLTKDDDISFWIYNRTIWLGVAASYAALILFAGGLSIALLSVHTLFDLKIDDKIYADIWLFSGVVLGPVYALSHVPERFTFFDDEVKSRATPGLGFIANWVSSPLVLIYLLILYAYFIKIFSEQALPNGQLAYMISGFAGAGVVTYLLAWPLYKLSGNEQKPNSPFLRIFYNIFFPALLIPAAVHIYAVWERVHAYGVTESRYALILSAIWFAGLALIFTIKRNAPLKIIPLFLAVLLFAGSFGPWGAVNISGKSQFGRLEKLLEKNGILENGKIKKVAHSITFKDKKSISSILDYLCASDRDYMIAGWFSDAPGKWSCSGGYELTSKMGFDYVSYYSTEDMGKYNLNFNAQNKQFSYIRGYDYLIKNISLYAKNAAVTKVIEPYNPTDEDFAIKIALDRGEYLIISIDDKKVFSYNLKEFVRAHAGRQDSSQPLFIEAQNDNIALRIDFSYLYAGKKSVDEENSNSVEINGNAEGDTDDNINMDNISINSMSFDLIFRLKKRG